MMFINDMLFINKEHAKFYDEKSRELKADVYLKAFLYTIGVCDDTRRRWSKLYNEKDSSICLEQLHQPWQTGSSRKVTRLAFQLFTDGTPTATIYDEGEGYKEDFNECQRYSVSDIFCCEFAPFFVQAVKIRYPEYFANQIFSLQEKPVKAIGR